MTIQSQSQSQLDRLIRRRRIIQLVISTIPILSRLFVIAGLLGALVLPTNLLSRPTYISENALQPGQVNTYWGWSQVHKADRYADQVEVWRHLPSKQRAQAIRSAFEKIGLKSEIQSYHFNSPISNKLILNGTNVHAILQAPRTDGTESLVLMASWLSRKPKSDSKGGDLNVRGIASILALANYLTTLNLWSKDIIFLISDGFVDGTHAWLQAYHDLPQSNLRTDRLRLRTGPIWAAINIDYPFHSFSHIAIHYEGINGQLPNLDLINTISHISRWTGSSPVTIHTRPLSSSESSSPTLSTYSRAAQTMLEQISYGLIGTPSGPEGLFTTYRIDSLSLFAVPSDGPHGFHTIGKIIESSLRSLNNLLERFHQSFFLYLIQNERKFISVGNYLFVTISVGIGISLLGLNLWRKLGQSKKFKTKQDKVNHDDSDEVEEFVEEFKGKDIVWSLKIISLCHLIGATSFWTIVRAIEPSEVTKSIRMQILFIFFISLPVMMVNRTKDKVGNWKILESIHLLLVGCLISVMSVLNFSIGAGLALLFGPPLALIPRSNLGGGLRVGWYGIFMILGSWLSRDWVLERVMFDDQCLGGWFLIFLVVLVIPLMIEGSVIGLMMMMKKKKK
ncbi:hypothetical protein CROQUDRAFT_66493 [Cronartium quercuum f. sp. fusiforme G11]|uniref:Gaa1-domain-containing protein n=1 Tax=Cronartium quercuum f. sp. fusiforme G11 TaxID=708437 RepID=A0A9P6NBM9_9BASI|nr:hypothetical protein CROQUDRAFT_66493 [Cronartium quercuum f. sp. fusiforme G11]